MANASSTTAATASATDLTGFARSTGLPAALGKASSELKCKLPDVVKDDFVQLSRSLGLNESELLREVVMLRLYGIEGVRRMHEQQLRMVAGMGPEAAEVSP